jgi:hypothetical protein
MAKKQNASSKSAPEKSILNKIAGEVGYIAGSIAVGKDHLVEMAGGAINSVKETIHNITTKKKNVPKKDVKAKALPKLAKPATKKLAKPVAPKKTTPVKKVIKKVAKKVIRKK